MAAVLALAVAGAAIVPMAFGSAAPKAINKPGISNTSNGESNLPSNGESSKPGPQVVKDAAAALEASGAVHLSGTLTDSSGSLKMDLHLQPDGSTGSLSVAGIWLDFIGKGGAAYIRAPQRYFLREGAPAATADKLADRWVKLPPGNRLINTFSMAAISKSLGDPKAQTSQIESKVTAGTLDGQRVVIVHQADGSKLFVAAVGRPYPLEIFNSNRSKDGAGRVKLSEFGKRTLIHAPADALDASATTA